MSNKNQIEFPCSSLPEQPALVRLVGLYPQQQEGLWMQRVRVTGGVLSPRQWLALGRIARDMTPGTPLHLTTRQDVQVHDVAPERVGEIHRALAETGLTGVGAGGDSLRNIVVCPCSGLVEGSLELTALAGQIQRTLEAMDGIRTLPRKFKISMSCRESCGQPWINDLGLVARKRDGRWGFQVVAGGSLGPRPGTGMEVFEWIPAEEVLALATASIEIFAAHGDREQRSRARLRHVRERIGDDVFSKLLRETFARTKSQQSWPVPELRPAQGGFAERVVLTFANGDLTPEAAEALAELAESEQVRVRIDTQHRVIIFGPDAGKLRRSVSGLAALAEAAKPQTNVVACPGTRWCGRALVDTNSLADRLRVELEGKTPSGPTVCLSGCPNGCAQSTVAVVGIVGRLVTRDGRKVEVYDLWTGGGLGQNPRLGTVVAQGLSAEGLLKAVVGAFPQAG